MITHDNIMAVLGTIDDPEMPISIVDLGIVEDVQIDQSSEREGAGAPGAHVSVTILPTFVGCPALPMIREEIEKQVGALVDVGAVEVQFVNDPPWTVDRITDAGREQLRQHGVTVPDRGGVCGSPNMSNGSSGNATSLSAVSLTTSAVPCPFCGSTKTRLESPFGPTRCRTIFYCDACRNAFEHLKRI